MFFTLHPVALAQICRHDPWTCVYAAIHPSPWSFQGCDVSRIIGWSKQPTRLDYGLAWHLGNFPWDGTNAIGVSNPTRAF